MSNSHPHHKDNHGSDVAARLIREQIENIYGNNVQTVAPAQQNVVADTEPKEPYNQTHQKLDLSQYHSAWQNYYQQYYHRYYSSALQKAKQELGKDDKKTSVKDHHKEVVVGKNPETEVAEQQSRNELLGKVKERAKKIKKSSHFMPIMSALVVGGIFLFLQFNSIMVAQVKAFVSPGALSSDGIIVDPSNNINVGPEARLIIPKINVDVPVNYDVRVIQEEAIQAGLRDSAVHYKLPHASSFPGQFGNTVILGHSGNDIFNAGEYKFVFVLLDKMKEGDIFYAHYKGKRYTYKVTTKKVISPKDIKALQINKDKPYMTLVTCTPPGTAISRLIVTAEQISPDPLRATQPIIDEEASSQESLPGTEKTLLQKFFDLF